MLVAGSLVLVAEMPLAKLINPSTYKLINHSLVINN
jgi:hypothetical protein